MKDKRELVEIPKNMRCNSVSLKGRYKFILTVLLNDDMFFDIDGDCLMVSLDADDYDTVVETTRNYIESVDMDYVNVDSLIEACLSMTEWFEVFVTSRNREEDKIIPNSSFLLGGCYILQKMKIEGYRLVIDE